MIDTTKFCHLCSLAWPANSGPIKRSPPTFIGLCGQKERKPSDPALRLHFLRPASPMLFISE